MNKIYSLGVFLALCFSVLFTVGCDLDGGGSSDDPFVFEETRYVQSRSEPTPDQQNEGVISILKCGDLTIFVMEYTNVRSLRDSCSGFNNGGVPEIGDLTTIFFIDDQVDWANGIVRPRTIEAVARECVETYSPDFVCEPCEE